MFEITNLDQVITQIDQWERDVNAMVEGVARGLSIELFRGVVERSAQYSGDFAANWKYSIGSPDYSFKPDVFGSGVVVGQYGRISRSPGNRLEGHGEAVAYANSQNRGRSSNYKLGQTIFVSNSAAHDEPYAVKIEDNLIKFRDGNRGAPGQRTLDNLLAQYGVITADKARKLMGRTL